MIVANYWRKRFIIMIITKCCKQNTVFMLKSLHQDKTDPPSLQFSASLRTEKHTLKKSYGTQILCSFCHFGKIMHELITWP